MDAMQHMKSIGTELRSGSLKTALIQVFALPERGWELLALWQERLRVRQTLARIEPHLLDDMGISPEDAARESAKPFWRA